MTMGVIRNGRFWLVFGPSLAAVLVGIVVPDQLPFLIGAAAGWAVIATSILRSHERMEYQAAIRQVRRGNYVEAIRTMDGLLIAEPHSVDHHHFRAELHRFSGNLDLAAADYKWMAGRDLGWVLGHLGLAEIAIQQGDYEQARDYSLAALERDKSWMAVYDLGLIEDRQGRAESAVMYLERAFAAGIPESRYRLLARLWLARNYHRLGRDDDARQQIARMRKESKGVRDWQKIFESDQGAVLRDMFESDVQLAQQLLSADSTLEALD